MDYRGAMRAFSRQRASRKPARAGYMGKSLGLGGRGRGFYGRYRRQAQTAELKFHDLSPADALITQAGTVITSSCLLIAQGTGESQRIGRRITIRSIQWRYDLILPFTTSVSNHDIVRIIVYQDKQTNGATASISDVLETDQYQSYYNLANKNRFRILYDRRITQNVAAAAGDGSTNDTISNAYQGTWNKRVNIPVEYSGTGGALTDLRSNNIGIMLLSKNGGSILLSKMRIRFSDS